MPIRKKNNGKFIADVTHPVAGRYRPTFATHKAALDWFAPALVACQNATALPPIQSLEDRKRPRPTCRHTLRQALLAAIDPVFKRMARPLQAQQDAEKVVNAIGPDTPVSHVTLAAVLDFREQRQQIDGVSPATVNRQMASFLSMMGYARDKGWLISTLSVPPLKVTEKTFRVYTHAEEAALVEASQIIDERWMKDVIFVLADTGCRLSELAKRGPGELTTGGLAWLIPAQNTKTNKPRTVSLTYRAKNSLINLSILRHSRPENAAEIKNAWAKLKRRVGMEGKGHPLHGWRHTCATRMLESGASLAAVRDHLGHADIATTARYAHVTRRIATKAVQDLENHTDD